jgi:hypothetical protein
MGSSVNTKNIASNCADIVIMLLSILGLFSLRSLFFIL